MRKHIMLLEMHNLRTMLLEDRIAFLQKNYMERLAKSTLWFRATPEVKREIAAMEGPPQTNPAETPTGKLFAYIVQFDPDGTKRNAQWLLNLLLKNNMQIEDLPEARDMITAFMQHQRQLPAEQRDLNRFKNLGDLEAALQPLKGTQVVSQRQADRQVEQGMFAQADVVYNDAQYRILIPKTVEAATYFGVNTRWCTAYTDPARNMFNTYAKQGPLYIVLDKANNRRWQFHFESNQFMDEMDRQINLQQFVQEHPPVAKFFESLDKNGEQVSTFEGNAVFKNEDPTAPGKGTIVFTSGGSGKGLLAGRAKLRLAYMNDTLYGGDNIGALGRGRGKWPWATYDNAEALEQVLNDLGMSVSEGMAHNLADFDIFQGSEQFGSLADVGARVLKVGEGYEWRGATIGESAYYVLVNDGVAEVSAFLNEENKSFLCVKPETKEQQHAIAKLVAILDIEDYAHDDDAFNAYDLDDDAHAHIMDAKPHLARVDALYEKHGPQYPAFRKALKSILTRGDVNFTDEYVGDRLILERYDNAHELADDNGDKSAKWFSDVLTGDEHINVHSGEVDRSDVEEMLGWLKPDQVRRFGEMLAVEHEEWITDQQEYDEDFEFDPTDIDQIAELLMETEDYDNLSPFNSAKSSGYETGANDEASKIWQDAFTSNPYILFKDDRAEEEPEQGELDLGDKPKAAKYTAEYRWDAEAVVAPRIEEILAEIKAEPSLDQWRYEGKWLSLKEQKISPEEPSYGFTDYSDEAAKERFLDEIESILPDASDQP